MMETPAINDVFDITWNDKQYPCKRILMGESIVFVIGFAQRPLYLGKGVDVNQEEFWVSIPTDTKLSRVVREIGAQIDDHYRQANTK
jgi:hypothetical protein